MPTTFGGEPYKKARPKYH
ncbi:hypothetical protein [Staphylococcus aureus]